MALIEVFHVCASELPIDATVTTDIPQGVLVSLTATGYVQLYNGDSTTLFPIGIAGDSRSQGTTSYTPESGSALTRDPANNTTGALVTGAMGAMRTRTQNRVSDNYNEVAASGKMTVYHSGGEFWTDQYEIVAANGSTVNTYTPSTALYGSGAQTLGQGVSNQDDIVERTGRFTTEPSGTIALGLDKEALAGIILAAPSQYPNGVPGTDIPSTAMEGGNSMSWGAFLHLKLTL